MRGTPQKDCIRKMFVGQTKLYVKCINVNYESSKADDFYDVSVCVKGCRNIEEALAESIKPERLSGANKYNAEDHGSQVAAPATVKLVLQSQRTELVCAKCFCKVFANYFFF